jgi:hypothetical protein
LAIGVLSSEPTLFVNPNAHRLLHPPLLRDTTTVIDTPPPTPPAFDRPMTSRAPTAAVSGSANSNEAYFPIVRTLSPSTPGTTSYGLGEGYASTSRASGPSSPSLASTLASILPGRRRRNTEETGRTLLSQVRSREGNADEVRRRSWAFGRNRTGSTSNALALDRTTSGDQTRETAGIPMPAVLERDGSIAETKPLPAEATFMDHSPPTPFVSDARPYPIIRKPLPALGYANYPNYTSSPKTESAIRDTRYLHPEVEDNHTGQIWADEEPTHTDDIRLVEWNESRMRRERWVGPMMYVFSLFLAVWLIPSLVAQLHPAARTSRDRTSQGPTEGPTPDLGPQGMCASLAFEDIYALLPWVEFKGGGPHHAEAMRNGLGYE